MAAVKPKPCVSSKFMAYTFCLVPAVCALFLCACRSTPPPPVVPQAFAPPPMATPVPAEVQMDDIPADASPAIRGHLIKLREMRDLGQITDGEYQSRKASLLGR